MGSRGSRAAASVSGGVTSYARINCDSRARTGSVSFFRLKTLAAVCCGGHDAARSVTHILNCQVAPLTASDDSIQYSNQVNMC